MTKVSYLLPLDSFRGIAALSVVLLHLNIHGSFTDVSFFRHGGLGVPFFFVLSGFIMAYVYDNNAFSIKDFLIARVFRILPLYWFVLFLAIAFELCKYFASTYFHMSFGTQAFSGHNEVKEILPNLLLLQSWLPHTDSSSFNFPSWSLSVEWYLYIIFGSFMFLPKSLRYISFTILSLLSFIHYLDFLRPEAQKGVLFFFCGCVTYLVFTKLQNFNLHNTTLYIAEIFSLIAFLMLFQMGLENFSIVVFPIVILVFALGTKSNKNPYRGGGKHNIVSKAFYILWKNIL